MGSGAFGLVWPITIFYVLIINIKDRTLIKVNFSLGKIAKENLLLLKYPSKIFSILKFLLIILFNIVDSDTIFPAFKNSNSSF